MKIRLGFVSNSSSTSYTITNKSGVCRSMYEFVDENPHLLTEFVDEYEDGKAPQNYSPKQMLLDASGPYYKVFSPGGSEICKFGDEDGYVLGRVYDYILRDGGESTNFIWKFYEYNR